MTANIKIFATKQLNKTLSFITIEVSGRERFTPRVYIIEVCLHIYKTTT